LLSVGKPMTGAGRRGMDAPSEPDTLVLAERAASGDTAATARLLRLLAPAMARVVRGVMGPYSADTDDAMQQALIALVRALPAFRGECAPAGYACRIAFRTALALRKAAKVERVRRDSVAELELVLDTATLPNGSEARQRTELVRALLDEIPAAQAEALALRTMLGWSIEEIAEASAAPINTVRSRLRLAKEALRERIQADRSLAEGLGVAP
jgi:RNA polymerase sigma factor (sigma-70 family)